MDLISFDIWGVKYNVEGRLILLNNNCFFIINFNCVLNVLKYEY